MLTSLIVICLINQAILLFIILKIKAIVDSHVRGFTHIHEKIDLYNIGKQAEQMNDQLKALTQIKIIDIIEERTDEFITKRLGL